MIQTELCSILGIKYPLLQGGMAHISDAKLAAAVSNAGGLGIISASYGAKRLKEEILAAKELTDKPFGVNIMLMSPDADEIAELVCSLDVKAVTTGAGNPSKYMQMWNDNGIKVMPVVASVSLAKLMQRLGAAAVIAEGGESGGHVGETNTMALVPQVCDAISIPVVAAGGIADGRGFAAAMMLGAVGVQIGTRFLIADECTIHDNYKEKIIKATDISTVVTGRRLGHPVRSIKTPFSREYAKAEYTNIADDDLESMAVGSLKKAVYDGDVQNGCFLAGEICGMISQKMSCADIVEEIMSDAEKVISGGAKWVK